MPVSSCTATYYTLPPSFPPDQSQVVMKKEEGRGGVVREQRNSGSSPALHPSFAPCKADPEPFLLLSIVILIPLISLSLFTAYLCHFHARKRKFIFSLWFVRMDARGRPAGEGRSNPITICRLQEFKSNGPMIRWISFRQKIVRPTFPTRSLSLSTVTKGRGESEPNEG